MLNANEMQQLRERLSAYELLAPWVDEIAGRARTSIRLNVTDHAAGADESRLGGRAVLPVGMEWPRCDGAPQWLVAHIVLGDVAPLDRERALPAGGRLLFLYGRGRNDCWTVLHVPADVPLADHDVPQFPSRRVVPSLEISLPPWDFFEEMAWEEVREYGAFLDTYRADGERVTKLLGYSEPIHHSRDAGHEGRLLLQLDSEARAGMRWGDNGRLFYWLRADGTTDFSWECH